MSRVIKFRVWQEARTFGCGTQTITYPARWLDSESTLVNGRGTLYDNDGYENCLLANQSDFLTVEQFTGLKDLNGKEIYEGDIIRMGEPRYVDNTYIDSNVGVVQMFRMQWALHPVETLGKEHGGIIYFPLSEIPPVIGNIHENKDLLTP